MSALQVLVFCLLSSAAFAASIQAKHSYRNGNATVTIIQEITTGRADIEDGPYGGFGGDAWTDDGYQAYGPITGMLVGAGDRIDSIQVRYGETWGLLRGTDNGKPYLVEMGNGQPGQPGDPLLIDVILLEYTDYVNKLQFSSSVNGGNHGAYGGGGGTSSAVVHPTCELEYLSGKDGLYIDQLTFHFIC